MNPVLGFASLTLLGLAAAAPAADDLGGFVDMRLAYKTTSTLYQVDTTVDDEEENWDRVHRVELNWYGSLGLRRRGGMIWGLGGTWWYNDGDSLPAVDGSSTLQTWTVQGQLGYGLPLIAERLQFEVLPYAGFGRATLRTSEGSDADAYWEVGGNANLVWTFDSGLQLGGTASMWTYGTSVSDGVTRYRFRDAWPVAVGVFLGARL